MKVHDPEWDAFELNDKNYEPRLQVAKPSYNGMPGSGYTAYGKDVSHRPIPHLHQRGRRISPHKEPH